MSFDVPQDFLLTDCQSYCTRVADGTHETPTQAEVGKRLATSKNIKDGRLTLENSYLIPVAEFDEINKRSKVDQWDILISMIGTVGEVCLIDTPEPDFAIKNVGLLKCGDRCRGKWLYYYLRSPLAKELIEARKKGTTQQYISLGEIRRFPVIYPATHGQMSSVVSTLSALDDRITLLRETNATLEAIAQAIFKSWFVDFDPVRAKQEGRAPEGMDEATAALFPDSFEESALGLVPRGWRVSPVSEVVDTVGGGTPDTKDASYWEPAEYCWTTPKDLSGISAPVLLETERKLSAKGVAKISSGLLPAGTLLMSSRAPIGYLAITQTRMAINQGYIAMPPGGTLPPLYMLYWCRQSMDTIKSHANGSTFMEISKKAFRPLPTLVPPANLLEQFAAIAGALFDRLVENAKQTQTLAALRDTLLPRLISGQLRLTDAEAAIAETVA